MMMLLICPNCWKEEGHFDDIKWTCTWDLGTNKSNWNECGACSRIVGMTSWKQIDPKDWFKVGEEVQFYSTAHLATLTGTVKSILDPGMFSYPLVIVHGATGDTFDFSINPDHQDRKKAAIHRIQAQVDLPVFIPLFHVCVCPGDNFRFGGFGCVCGGT